MFSHRTDWKLTPNRFTQVQQELRAAGREVLDLTISNPTRADLHYDAEPILQAFTNPRAMDYDPQPKGLRSAREAVAGYYRKQHDIDPESIVLTTSTSGVIPTCSDCFAMLEMKSLCPSRAIRCSSFWLTC